MPLDVVTDCQFNNYRSTFPELKLQKCNIESDYKYLAFEYVYRLTSIRTLTPENV